KEAFIHSRNDLEGYLERTIVYTQGAHVHSACTRSGRAITPRALAALPLSRALMGLADRQPMATHAATHHTLPAVGMATAGGCSGVPPAAEGAPLAVNSSCCDRARAMGTGGAAAPDARPAVGTASSSSRRFAADVSTSSATLVAKKSDCTQPMTLMMSGAC